MRYKYLPSYIKGLLSLAWLMIALDKAKLVFSEEGKFVLRGKQYPLELLPIIDDLDIESPCDLIGKWLKPRTLAALNGVCLRCTPYQQENMEKWLLSLIHHNEDLFRIAMIKVCMDMKIEVEEEERIRTIPYLTRNDLRDYKLNKA